MLPGDGWMREQSGSLSVVSAPGPVKPVRTTVRTDLVAGTRVEMAMIASKPQPERAR